MNSAASSTARSSSSSTLRPSPKRTTTRGRTEAGNSTSANSTPSQRRCQLDFLRGDGVFGIRRTYPVGPRSTTGRILGRLPTIGSIGAYMAFLDQSRALNGSFMTAATGLDAGLVDGLYPTLSHMLEDVL